MKNSKKLQHVQLPNSLEELGLNHKDQFVYLVLKSFDGDDGCYPSLEKISERAGASVPTIRGCIKRLIDSGVLETKPRGRGNFYIFKKYLNYEPFSPEFFKTDLSFGTKAYMAAMQQYLIKDVKGIGKISISRRKLSDKLNMPESSARKCDKELERKGVLQIIKNKTIDLETGCKTNTRIYDLQSLGQMIIWKLKDHEDRITTNEEEIKSLKDKLEAQDKLIKKLLENNKSEYDYKV